MELVFLGTPAFSVPSLRALVDDGHHLRCVVTRPDRPRGRGRQPSPPAVKRAAKEQGLTVYQPEDINSPEAIRRIGGTGARLGVVVAYGEILCGELLKGLPEGFINLHASLLPRYRGAAPINRAIVNGEEETGVTVQRMVQKMDAGPILHQRSVGISADETAGELHDRLAEVGARALSEVLARMDRGEDVTERPQDPSQISYAPALDKEDGRVDWTMPAAELDCFVRGMTPWPGATSQFHGNHREEQVTLLEVTPLPERDSGTAPGTLVNIDEEDRPVVQTGRGMVLIKRIKPANSSGMDGSDFVHGHRAEVGDEFGGETR
ncbi:MAG: methionyl-tRNA formyltransferase [Planctomycetota bacterium]